MKTLEQKAKSFGINLTPEQLNQFQLYYEYLCEYNSHTNIVASSDKEIVITKHFLDSLAFNKIPAILNDFTLIDIGSGGGFPAIPIAIAFPSCKVTAVDSVGKKTTFLENLIKKLGIENRVTILNKRAEDLDNNLKNSFDFSTARAVAPLNILAEYCLPFVKPDGFFIAYKAKTAKDEVKDSKNALHVLGGTVAEIISYELDENTMYNLVITEKIENSSLKYPRKSGMPKKKPL